MGIYLKILYHSNMVCISVSLDPSDASVDDTMFISLAGSSGGGGVTGSEVFVENFPP